MSYSNGFLQVSPAVKRPIHLIKVNQKQSNSFGQIQNLQRKRIPSSIDTYSAGFKQMTIKEIIHEKYLNLQKRKQKSLPHTIQTNRNNLHVQNNTNNEHVIKTIDSVNQYAEQLRLTLIKQYKAQKMKSIRAKKAKGSDEPLTTGAEFQTLDDLTEVKTKSKEETSKHPAYKTLNLLYQAIIDNSFKNRKKDEFQLQAIRLPIVDRFNNRTQTLRIQRELNSKCKYDHTRMADLSLPQPKLYLHTFHKTKATFHTHKIQIKRQKSKSLQRLPNEDSQIVPWMVVQQSILE